MSSRKTIVVHGKDIAVSYVARRHPLAGYSAVCAFMLLICIALPWYDHIVSGQAVSGLMLSPWLYMLVGGLALLLIAMSHILRRQAVVLTNEGIWRVGFFSPPLFIEWNEITKVCSSGLGMRNYFFYVPFTILLHHATGVCKVDITSFDQPAGAVQMIRSKIPANAQFDDDLDVFIKPLKPEQRALERPASEK